MSDFYLGDRVIMKDYLDKSYEFVKQNKLIGTIVDTTGRGNKYYVYKYFVQWDNGEVNNHKAEDLYNITLCEDIFQNELERIIKERFVEIYPNEQFVKGNDYLTKIMKEYYTNNKSYQEKNIDWEQLFKKQANEIERLRNELHIPIYTDYTVETLPVQDKDYYTTHITVVTLDYLNKSYIGISKCCYPDKYNKYEGLVRATGRALRKLKKDIQPKSCPDIMTYLSLLLDNEFKSKIKNTGRW